MSSPVTSSRVARLFGVVKTLLSVTLALGGLVFFLAWMGGAFHEKIPPGQVPVERPSAAGRTLVTVRETTEPATVSAVGSVQPRRKVDIASQLLASIREIKPRPGDKVSAGDLLVILDDRELVAQSREATAGLASAEADLVTRKSDYERIKGLRGTGSLSAEEFNRVEGAYRVAETQVQRAKETISRIDILISYAKIRATSDGIVSDRMAEPGDLATPGKSLLAIYDPNDLELQANVPESLAAGLVVGQQLEVRIDANNLSTKAKIREIVPLAQQASRSVLIKLGLPQSAANPILPGMFGRTAIPMGQSRTLVIPKAALIRQGQLDLVEVDTGDGFLSRRFVRIGQERNDQVEVLSGLNVGERIAIPAK